MLLNWLQTQAVALAGMTLSAIGVYAALLLFTRLAGLRSFSKLSSFDFAITVAFGSVIASAILSPRPSLATAVFGLALLYVMQYAVSRLRLRSARLQRLVDNEPLVVMAGSQVLESNLRAARVTQDDLRARLRRAGVTRRQDVRAVIVETTGDISVLRNAEPLDPWLLTGVRDAQRVDESVASNADTRA